MHQQPLQNVAPALQMYSSHSAGLVHVRETSFGQFGSRFLQPLVPRPLPPPAILIDSFLLDGLALALPLPASPIRLRNIAAQILVVQMLQNRSTVIALVGHHFLD